MPTVTIPRADQRPELWSAFQILARAGAAPAKVLAIYAAGDPQAMTDSFGLPRETVLFVNNDGNARTALLTRDGKVLMYAEGWPAE